MPSIWPRQGALSGVTSSVSSAGQSAYGSAKGATSNLSTGQIAAAIVAIVVGFVLICMMLWYLCTRRLRQRSRLNSSENNGIHMRQQQQEAAPRTIGGAATKGGYTAGRTAQSQPMSTAPSAQAPTPAYGFGGRNSRNAWRNSRVMSVRSGDDDAESFLSESTAPLAPAAKRSDSRLDALTQALSPQDGSGARGSRKHQYAQI